jgi:lysophospholipase L1-like esterase
MQRVALLGDSILDNSAYTSPEPDTTECLQRGLGPGWTVDLLARDGSTMADLRFQLSHLSATPDAAVLSIGGNDAVDHIGILDQRASGSAEVLAQLAGIAEDFRDKYRKILTDLKPRVRRLIVCTIYEPPLTDALTAGLAKVPLTLLNDQIIQEALRAQIDVLDLRTVCTETSDFVMEIEPSPLGARKIAAAIQAVLLDGLPRPPISLFAV